MGERLQGKRTILTGAASGIGRASAISFAREGARLVLVDVSEAGLQETAALARKEGAEVFVEVADVGDEEHVGRFVGRCREAFGGVDVLFANAGISGGVPTLNDLTTDQFQEILRVNLIGPYLAVKMVAPLMVEQGHGSILCTASVAGIRANAGSTAYSASKAGVISLVQTVAAQELNNTGVRINAICPGLIETGMTKPLFEYAAAVGKTEQVGQYAPMGRYGLPEEIAAVALFLASDEASYVHGQAIAVDGGITSTLPYRPHRRKAPGQHQGTPLPGFAKKA